MPSKITMAGGAPWGFRLSGGGVQPLTVSRLTPGGKASLDGILTGDHVTDINGTSVSGLQLGELMELIKNTGDILNLTIINPAEFEAAEACQQEEQDVRANLHEEHIESLTVEQEAAPVAVSPVPEEVEVEEQVEEEIEQEVEVEEEPARFAQEAMDMMNADDADRETMTKKEWYALPKYIRQQVRPPKSTPQFKPQVNWLHGKLRLNADHNSGSAVNAAGGELRNAVLAQAGPIEIQAGPINGKITHGQYNTPLNMYSDPNIVSTLLSQAIASGADIQDASYFENTGVKVDTQSSTYKTLHRGERESAENSKQSRSFNILNTLMKHPYEQVS